MSAPFSEVAARLRSGKPAVVAYSIGGNSSSALEKRILPEGDPLTRETLRVGPAIAGEGERAVYLEPVVPRERLIVFGAGHIAVPLADIARKIDFAVVVVDDRPSFANAARFGDSATVMCEYFPSSIPRLRIAESDYVVIVTRGHRHDLECLRAVLSGTEPRYVGMIGSRRRVALAREKLLSDGVDPARLSRVCSPIGLSIGAVSPSEIAVSIVAEIIARKRIGPDGVSRPFSTDLDATAVEELARDDAGPRASVTIVSADGSVPRGVGAKMVVYPGGRVVGSIGGGCAESDAIKLSLDIIGTGRWFLREIDLSGATAEDDGMVCGGSMRVLIEDVGDAS